MAENNCSRPVTQTWYSVTYGTPNPRFIRPLVRINGMTEDVRVLFISSPSLFIIYLDEPLPAEFDIGLSTFMPDV